MTGVSQRFIQSPEAADETFGVHGNRLGEVTTLRRYGSDDGYASLCAAKGLHHAGTLIESGQTGCQVCRETFLGRHFLQTAGQLTECLCPTGCGVCHDCYIIAHIAVILSQCQAGIQRCLTGCNRHVGCVGDQGGTVHQRVAALRVDQFLELLQNLCHLVSTLSTSDIDDDIGIRPFCDLVLGHGFSGTESARDGCCAAFCDREHRIQDTLSCDQRNGCRISFQGWTRYTDRPFLCQCDLFFGAVFQFQFYNRIKDGVLSVFGSPDNRAVDIRRNHRFVYDGTGLLCLCNDCAAHQLFAF